MTDELEQQYGYLWRNLDEGWVLLKAPDLLGGHCLFNKLSSTLLCIENDEVNTVVCRRLKE